MNLLELLQTLLLIGLPVGCLTWLLFHRLYASGRIHRESDEKQLKQELKALKKSVKEDKSDLINTRWMKFGGGFYGIAALWTFVVIEATDIVSFLWNFPGLSALFQDGIISFVVGVLINQFTNFINAFLWFAWWPQNEGDASVILWFGVAYVCYLAGFRLARAGVDPADLSARCSARFSARFSEWRLSRQSTPDQNGDGDV
ncbi:MAG: hypothetical protein ACFHX7_08245 [Pseudomonadota bacterium]